MAEFAVPILPSRNLDETLESGNLVRAGSRL
jgi:hypothetical protein